MDFTTKQQVPLDQMIQVAQQQGQANAGASGVGQLASVVSNGAKGMAEGLKLSEAVDGIMQKKAQRQKMADAMKVVQNDPDLTDTDKAVAATLSDPESLGTFLAKRKEDIAKNNVKPDAPTDTVVFNAGTGQYFAASDLKRTTPLTNVPKGSIVKEFNSQGVNAVFDPASITPTTKANAEAYYEGRKTFSPYLEAKDTQLANAIMYLHPDFDSTLAPQRAAKRKDFSEGGASGKQILSYNTLLGHLTDMEDAVGKLDNGKFQDFNKYKNILKVHTGDPAVALVRSLTPVIGGESAKNLVGSINDRADREELAQGLSDVNSPEQFQAVIDGRIKLMGDRLSPLREAWQSTMGDAKPPVPFLTPSIAKKLQAHGYDTDTMSKVSQAQVNTSAGALNPATLKQGDKIMGGTFVGWK